MKILITGGFGFLGSHLLEKLLLDMNNEIHVVDNLSSNPIPYDVLLKELNNNRRITYDIQNISEYCITKINEFDIIFHLASIVGPVGVLPHIGEIVPSIVYDTECIINFALENNSKLINISTSEVYGGGVQGLCEEYMDCVIPNKSSARLEYALGKLSSEVMINNKVISDNLNAISIRPFNITGTRQSDKGGFVLPKFIKCAIKNEDIPIFGNGTQCRSFTNVKDIVDGMLILSEKAKIGEVYNLGNIKNKCTINELADCVIKVTNSKSKKIHIDPKTIYGDLYEEANDKFSYANVAKELGWSPKFNLIETVEQTYKYIQGI